MWQRIYISIFNSIKHLSQKFCSLKVHYVILHRMNELALFLLFITTKGPSSLISCPLLYKTFLHLNFLNTPIFNWFKNWKACLPYRSKLKKNPIISDFHHSVIPREGYSKNRIDPNLSLGTIPFPVSPFSFVSNWRKTIYGKPNCFPRCFPSPPKLWAPAELKTNFLGGSCSSFTYSWNN